MGLPVGFLVYPFTPPRVRPVMKYRCTKGYTHRMGKVVITVIAMRMDWGVLVTAPPAFNWLCRSR